MGSNEPAMLLTMKMKKMGMCRVRRRSELIWRMGRTISMVAPVVPMRLARIAPRNRMKVLVMPVCPPGLR